MKKWIFVLLLVSHPALAGDFRLDVNLASKHFVEAPDALQEYNERNLGLGLEYRFGTKYHFIAGQYANSINRESYYAGFGRLLKSGSTEYFWSNYEIGVELGLANGYKDFTSEDGRIWSKANDYSLMGGPYVRLGNTHALKLRYAISVASAGYQFQF